VVGYQLKGTLSDFGTVSRGICVRDEHGFLQKIEEITKIGIHDKVTAYDDGSGQWQPLTGNEIVSARLKPKVRFLSAGLCESLCANQLIIRESTSLKLCKASVSRERLFEIKPPII